MAINGASHIFLFNEKSHYLMGAAGRTAASRLIRLSRQDMKFRTSRIQFQKNTNGSDSMALKTRYPNPSASVRHPPVAKRNQRRKL